MEQQSKHTIPRVSASLMPIATLLPKSKLSTYWRSHDVSKGLLAIFEGQMRFWLCELYKTGPIYAGHLYACLYYKKERYHVLQ